jgi:hypothetical protein
MNEPNHNSHLLCKWCGAPLLSPRPGQRFCVAKHRYLFHQAVRGIPLAKLEETIRAIVRQELISCGVAPRT